MLLDVWQQPQCHVRMRHAGCLQGLWRRRGASDRDDGWRMEQGTYAGIPLEMPPLVILLPAFASSLADVRSRFQVARPLPPPTRLPPPLSTHPTACVAPLRALSAVPHGTWLTLLTCSKEHSWT